MAGRGIDLRAAAWWVALGALAGAVAGLVWGGIGGRLVMLALRATSPDAVGVDTERRVRDRPGHARGSLNLAAVTTLGGAFAGVLYVAVRTGVGPGRARAAGGALRCRRRAGRPSVSPDGIDQRILEPRWLTVGAFIVLPAAATLTIVLIVERLGRRGPRVAPPAPRRLAMAARVAVTLAGVLLTTVAAVTLADAVGQVA